MKRLRAWAKKHDAGLIYLTAFVLTYGLGSFSMWAAFHSERDDARETCSLVSGRWVDSKSMCVVPELIGNQLTP